MAPAAQPASPARAVPRDRISGLERGATLAITTALLGTLAFALAGSLLDVRAGQDLQIAALTALLALVCVLALLASHARSRRMELEVEAWRAAEERATALARHDPLTGLPHRQFFATILDEALQAAKADRSGVAVLILDMDGFKPINDVHGPNVADGFIVEFAGRMQATAGSGTVLARVGGDDFALLQRDVRSIDQPTRLARRLMVAAREPFQIGGLTAQLGVRIGIAIGPDDAASGDVLLRRAEMALAEAKSEPGGVVRYFEPQMNAHVVARAQIETELRAALAESAIVPHYQPIFALEGDRVIAFEALARWHSPKLGRVSPAQFIPVAEESGIVRELGGQLLRRACLDALHWPADVTLAFNVSPHQLRDRAIGLRILSILRETGFPAARLDLEISDRALTGDTDAVRAVCTELRLAGVRLTLGGFGTGYATVSQLLKLRLDKIKVDRSIVQRLERDSDARTILRAMVNMAGSLGLSVCAEGVENGGQLAQVRAAGCREGQGFQLGRPMAPSEVPALLRRASLAARTVSSGAAAG